MQCEVKVGVWEGGGDVEEVGVGFLFGFDPAVGEFVKVGCHGCVGE